MNTGPMQTSLMLDGAPLSIEHVCDVARRSRPVEVSAAAVQVMLRSRAVIESALTDGEAHYGINTGFGSLSQKRIDPKDLRDLQRNLVRSHAAGVGDPLPEDGVRAMMLILAGSFCRGLSGVRPDLARLITGMLNAGVTPVVPSIGSVGASGDLAPLAHIGLVLIGEGHARVKGGSPLDGSQALAKAGHLISQDERNSIEQAKTRLQTAMSGPDVDELVKAIEELGQATRSLAVILMNAVVKEEFSGKTEADIKGRESE